MHADTSSVTAIVSTLQPVPAGGGPPLVPPPRPPQFSKISPAPPRRGGGGVPRLVPPPGRHHISKFSPGAPGGGFGGVERPPPVPLGGWGRGGGSRDRGVMGFFSPPVTKLPPASRMSVNGAPS